jgi:hypothetical protein
MAISTCRRSDDSATGSPVREFSLDRLPSRCHRRPGCLVSRLRVNRRIRKVMVMRVFVAGGTGVVGRQPPSATQEGATK